MRIVMKISIFILFSAIYIGSVQGSILAQESMYKDNQAPKQETETLIGTVVSIDPARNEIVLENITAGWKRSAIVDPQILPSLKIGNVVKVVLIKGTDKAINAKNFIRKKSKRAKERKQREKEEKEKLK